MYVNIIDDADFNTLCKKNGIDSSKYYSDSAKALLMYNILHKEYSSPVFSEYISGTDLAIRGVKGSKIEIEGFAKYKLIFNKRIFVQYHNNLQFVFKHIKRHQPKG